ncbi:MAG: hypothetical protein QG650_952 [Patescibacteria group bacterium]|nr:hypothetical protein [Patescibacteria group bacterium]
MQKSNLPAARGNQEGALGLGLGAVLAAIGLVIFYVMLTYNQAARFENELDTAYKNNQNVLSNAFYGPMDVAKLGEEKYRTMMKEMVEATAKGYQGATGGKAMMLWLGQTYPQITADLQMKLVSIGEAGLAKFQSSQTNLLDRGREYQNFLDTFPSGVIAGVLGFPKKVNLKEILTPVTDDQTEQSFKNKKRAPIQ